jgi:hypothetical protein
MDTIHINNIKKKLKEDYNFIKNDGAVLQNVAIDLLTENNNDYQKTIEFIDTLSKKNIYDRMLEMYYELETAGEISLLISDITRKEELKIYNLRLEIDNIEHEISVLNNKKQELNDIDALYDKYYSNRYTNEFNYDNCNYIIKENNYIYLNVDKILDDLTNNTCTINNICKDNLCIYNEYNKYITNGNQYSGLVKGTYKLNYPIKILLQENEQIIKIFINKDISYKTYKHEPVWKKKCNNNQNVPIIDTLYSKINVIYLTNFGRFIKSNECLISNKMDSHTTHVMIMQTRYYKYIALETIIYNNKNLSKLIYNYDNYNFDKLSVKSSITEIYDSHEITQATKLNYRMPRLFLDVINAFHTQNNELMQECCKKYLSITRTKGTDEQIIDNIEFNRIIKDKETIIIEKDNVIEIMNKRIEEQNSEIEKMKLEIAKLKPALTVFTS